MEEVRIFKPIATALNWSFLFIFLLCLQISHAQAYEPPLQRVPPGHCFLVGDNALVRWAVAVGRIQNTTTIDRLQSR